MYVCMYEYVIRPPQTKISGYAPTYYHALYNISRVLHVEIVSSVYTHTHCIICILKLLI